jgi:hypothetical protein
MVALVSVVSLGLMVALVLVVALGLRAGIGAGLGRLVGAV